MFAGSFWKTLGYSHSESVPKALDWKSYHFTTKSGPNGHALGSAVEDLFALPKTLVVSLKRLGGENFSKEIDNHLNASYFRKFIWETFSYLTFYKQGNFRKLVYFPDKEVKVRIIAILDYWSQTALKPFHHWLFRVLKKIPQDCTFDQGSFRDKLKGAEIFYSIDLSNATDRFPIALIGHILRGQLPGSWVRDWTDVMIGYPFYCQWLKKFISYNCGNPMGAYSSWASFAVSHHYLIYYCCKILGREWKTLPYVLLGDDIVIGDSAIAKLYLETLDKLGISISKEKTHTSTELYEFAKRWIYKGQEISPFPIASLKESSKKNYLFVNTLRESEKKGWICSSSITEAIVAYKARFFNYPSRLRKRLFEDVLIIEHISKIIRDLPSAHLVLTELMRKLKINLVYELDIISALKVIEYLAITSFVDSYSGIRKPSKAITTLKSPIKHYKHTPSGEILSLEDMVIKFNRGKTKVIFSYHTGWVNLETPEEIQLSKEWLPIVRTEMYHHSLGALAEWIVLFLSEKALTEPQALDLLSTPLLRSYGRIEEVYINLRKRGLEIESQKTDWPIVLKTIAIPLTDEIFYTRSHDLVFKTSAIMGKKLKPILLRLAELKGAPQWVDTNVPGSRRYF